MPETIQPAHLSRLAIVYVRQSSPNQVLTNRESLKLQYTLRDKASTAGWPTNQVRVIDTDLGRTARTSAGRPGFQELVALVNQERVGIIFAYDVTRLARNCTDWYALLDLCGFRHCLVGDQEGIYDPATPNGRLILGLKGLISELELHTIRARLTAGLLAKAERGELALTLPVGLVRDPSGLVVKDPNIEVQQRLELLFQTFLRLRTVAKVMRLFNGQGLDLPRRDRHGDVIWVRATVAAVAAILKNPAYAGAFVYGRTRLREPRSEGRSAMKAPRPMGEWRIIVKDRYPAYIDWPTYENIRAVIKDNRAEYMINKTRGAPRDGDLLLHGIAWCGRCRHKMYVRYKKGGESVCHHLRTPHALPTCPHVRAERVDEAVSLAFLAALARAEIEALS